MSVKCLTMVPVTKEVLKYLKVKFPCLEEWNPKIEKDEFYFQVIRDVDPLTEPATGIIHINKIIFCNAVTGKMETYQRTEATAKLQFFIDILPKETWDQYQYILTSETVTVGMERRTVFSLHKLVVAEKVKNEIAKHAEEAVDILQKFLEG